MRLNSCVWIVAGAMLSGCFVDRARYVSGLEDASADAITADANDGASEASTDSALDGDASAQPDAMPPARAPRLVSPLSSTNVATGAITFSVEHDGTFYVEFNRKRDFTGEGAGSAMQRGTGVLSVTHQLAPRSGEVRGVWFFRACAMGSVPAACSAIWSINVLAASTTVSKGGLGVTGNVMGSRAGDVLVTGRRPDGSHMSRGYLFSTLDSSSMMPSSTGLFDECTGLHRLMVDRCAMSTAGLLLGRSGAMLGDADGDGRADVALYGDQGEASDAGTIAMLNSFDDATLRYVGRFSGNMAVPLLGSIAAAGDFNGDGYADLVALVQDDAGKRRVDVFLSNGGAFPFANDRRVPLPILPMATLPMSVRPLGVGDFNGDGYGDIAVPAKSTVAGTDELWIYLGNAEPLTMPPTVVRVLSGSRTNFAASIAAAGDANGDGLADVFVTHGPVTGAANVALVSSMMGDSAQVSEIVSAATTSRSTQLRALVGAGDFNGDGLADAVMVDSETIARTFAVIYRSTPGSAGMFSVATGVIAPLGTETFAPRVVVRDVDGDGRTEVIVPVRTDMGEQGPVRTYSMIIGAEVRVLSTLNNPDSTSGTFGIDVY